VEDLASVVRLITEAIASHPDVRFVRVWRRVDGTPHLRLIASSGTGPSADDALSHLPADEVERWIASREPGHPFVRALVSDGQDLGLLTVVTRSPPAAEAGAWLATFAVAVAAAIANADATAHNERARTELERENARLRAELHDVFEEAPIAYVHEGLDTRFIRANRAALELLGITAEDVAGTLGKSFVSETSENQRRLTEALEGIALGNETRHAILELRRKDDGKPVWVEWWSQPADGGAYTRTMMVDITERVLMEKAKETLELSLKSGQIGEWDLDLTNGTSRRSLRHDQCFGYATPIPEAEWNIERFIAHVHPVDRERVESGMRRAIAELKDWACEFRVVWPDGHQHWLAARGSIPWAKDGKAERMLGVIIDVTERVRIEETLREMKASLDFALESARVGDWDLDVIHDTSRRSLRHDQCFGYNEPIPEQDWGIEAFRQHIHPEDRERVVNGLRGSIEAMSERWSEEFRVVWRDGSVHWLVAYGSIYKPQDGRATRMLGIVMDITDRKEAEQALRASQQLSSGQVGALKGILDALATEPSSEGWLEHILRTAAQQFGAHSLSVWCRDQSSERIGLEYAFESGKLITKADSRFAGLSRWLPMEDRWPWPGVFRDGKPSLIEDIRAVPAFPLRDRLLPMGIITVLLVPMSIAGQIEGALGLRFSDKRQFRAEEVELAQALANHAMLMIQLNRLSAQSREAAVIAERNRMARDIHDTLAQGFTGVVVQLEAATDATSKGLPSEAQTHIEKASRLARESLQEARRSLKALRPQELDDAPFTVAVAALIRRVTDGSGVHSEFIIKGTPRELPPEWDGDLMRIAQEVAANMLRHAKARRFDVEMTFAPDQVQLDLRDDGGGFDPSLKHDGFGLIGIGERVERMGGSVVIRSAKGAGTRVSIALPMLNERMQ
jgi:PAS domain S-box-containing protein